MDDLAGAKSVGEALQGLSLEKCREEGCRSGCSGRPTGESIVEFRAADFAEGAHDFPGDALELLDVFGAGLKVEVLRFYRGDLVERRRVGTTAPVTVTIRREDRSLPLRDQNSKLHLPAVAVPANIHCFTSEVLHLRRG